MTTNLLPQPTIGGNAPGPVMLFRLSSYQASPSYISGIVEPIRDYVHRASWGQARAEFSIDTTTPFSDYPNLGQPWAWLGTNLFGCWVQPSTAQTTVIHEWMHSGFGSDCYSGSGTTWTYAGDLKCPWCYGGWCGNYSIAGLPYAEGAGFVTEDGPFRFLAVTNSGTATLSEYESFTAGVKGIRLPWRIVNYWRVQRADFGSGPVVIGYQFNRQEWDAMYLELRADVPIGYELSGSGRGKKRTPSYSVKRGPGIQGRVWERYGREYWGSQNGNLQIKPRLWTAFGYGGAIGAGTYTAQQEVVDIIGTTTNISHRTITINVSNLSASGATVTVDIQ